MASSASFNIFNFITYSVIHSNTPFHFIRGCEWLHHYTPCRHMWIKLLWNKKFIWKAKNYDWRISRALEECNHVPSCFTTFTLLPAYLFSHSNCVLWSSWIITEKYRPIKLLETSIRAIVVWMISNVKALGSNKTEMVLTTYSQIIVSVYKQWRDETSRSLDQNLMDWPHKYSHILHIHT